MKTSKHVPSRHRLSVFNTLIVGFSFIMSSMTYPNNIKIFEVVKVIGVEIHNYSAIYATKKLEHTVEEILHELFARCECTCGLNYQVV